MSGCLVCILVFVVIVCLEDICCFGCLMVFTSWFKSLGLDVKVCNGFVWLCVLLDWIVVVFKFIFCRVVWEGILVEFVIEILILCVVILCFCDWEVFEWIVEDNIFLEFWGFIFVLFILFLVCILFEVNVGELILMCGRDDLVWFFEDVIVDGIVICSICELVRIWLLWDEKGLVVILVDCEIDNFFIGCNGELGCIVGVSFIVWFVDLIGVDIFLVWFVCFILGFGFFDDVNGFLGLFVVFKGFFFGIIFRGNVDFLELFDVCVIGNSFGFVV